MGLETVASYNGGDVELLADVDELTGVVLALEVHNASDQPCRVGLARSTGDTMNRQVAAGTSYRRVLTVPIADGLDELGETVATRLTLAHPAT